MDVAVHLIAKQLRDGVTGIEITGRGHKIELKVEDDRIREHILTMGLQLCTGIRGGYYHKCSQHPPRR